VSRLSRTEQTRSLGINLAARNLANMGRCLLFRQCGATHGKPVVSRERTTATGRV